MSVYAIGDIQGCYADMRRLAKRLNFDPSQDTLLFAGDLVNRGPNSLETLRWIKGLGSAARCVLGNHDFHLLAAAEGHDRYIKKSDTLREILKAPDAEELLTWLRHQPLLLKEKGYYMVHAGIYPKWTMKQAKKKAQLVEQALTGKKYKKLLKNLYGNSPDKWEGDGDIIYQWRFVINAFTRMRFLRPNGRLEFATKSNIRLQSKQLIPWFSFPGREVVNKKILFGHWSTLSQRQFGNAYALDTGCIWGGRLTALEISRDPPVWHSMRCPKGGRKD
jgi:bis(5'-nucleosyl)-tetraphosphatase (symmetrical)